MFYDTEIKIYLNPDSASYIKSIYADFQPFSGTVRFNYGLSLEISKKIFCDIDKDINEEAYFGIDENLFKVLYIKEWSDHMEVSLYRCKRVVD